MREWKQGDPGTPANAHDYAFDAKAGTRLAAEFKAKQKARHDEAIRQRAAARKLQRETNMPPGMQGPPSPFLFRKARPPFK